MNGQALLLSAIVGTVFQAACPPPMVVAEQFTGRPGRYVKVRDTIRGFRMILDGAVDHIPEPMFYMAGPIEEVLERYDSSQADE